MNVLAVTDVTYLCEIIEDKQSTLVIGQAPTKSKKKKSEEDCEEAIQKRQNKAGAQRCCDMIKRCDREI